MKIFLPPASAEVAVKVSKNAASRSITKARAGRREKGLSCDMVLGAFLSLRGVFASGINIVKEYIKARGIVKIYHERLYFRGS